MSEAETEDAGGFGPIADAVSALAEAAAGWEGYVTADDLASAAASAADLAAARQASAVALGEAAGIKLLRRLPVHDPKRAQEEIKHYEKLVAHPPRDVAARHNAVLALEALMRHDTVMLGMMIKGASHYYRTIPAIALGLVAWCYSGSAAKAIARELNLGFFPRFLIGWAMSQGIRAGVDAVVQRSHDWIPPGGAIEAAEAALRKAPPNKGYAVELQIQHIKKLQKIHEDMKRRFAQK